MAYGLSDDLGDWPVFLEFVDFFFGEADCNTCRHTPRIAETALIFIA